MVCLSWEIMTFSSAEVCSYIIQIFSFENIRIFNLSGLNRIFLHVLGPLKLKALRPGLLAGFGTLMRVCVMDLVLRPPSRAIGTKIRISYNHVN